jgi:hypothetical protein
MKMLPVNAGGIFFKNIRFLKSIIPTFKNLLQISAIFLQPISVAFLQPSIIADQQRPVKFYRYHF